MDIQQPCQLLLSCMIIMYLQCIKIYWCNQLLVLFAMLLIFEGTKTATLMATLYHIHYYFYLPFYRGDTRATERFLIL